MGIGKVGHGVSIKGSCAIIPGTEAGQRTVRHGTSSTGSGALVPGTVVSLRAMDMSQPQRL